MDPDRLCFLHDIPVVKKQIAGLLFNSFEDLREGNIILADTGLLRIAMRTDLQCAENQDGQREFHNQ